MGRVEKEVNEVVKGEEERRGGETVGGGGKTTETHLKVKSVFQQELRKKKSFRKG